MYTIGQWFNEARDLIVCSWERYPSKVLSTSLDLDIVSALVKAAGHPTGPGSAKVADALFTANPKAGEALLHVLRELAPDTPLPSEDLHSLAHTLSHANEKLLRTPLEAGNFLSRVWYRLAEAQGEEAQGCDFGLYRATLTEELRASRIKIKVQEALQDSIRDVMTLKDAEDKAWADILRTSLLTPQAFEYEVRAERLRGITCRRIERENSPKKPTEKPLEEAPPEEVKVLVTVERGAA